jgi:UDP-3-O-[3-hydroxymyristoyl] glucosamine N-acyltransferase
MKLTLEKIAEYLQGEVKGDAQQLISAAAPFEIAGAGQITFAGGAKYLKKLADCPAGAIIVPKGAECPSKNLICVKNPQVAFIRIFELLHPAPKPSAYLQKSGISPDARIGENFVCSNDAAISHFVTIGNDVCIGERTVIYPGAVIGNGVKIGDDAIIYPNAVILDRCVIGHRVIIHAGAVIGSDGFGFAPDGEAYCKIPHRGIVQIDDDVEIGANNTIDRATFGKTWIQKGVKTDNLIHIAHNVVIGENTLLVAQVGISGSTKIGKHCILAGQAGISGHLTIEDNVTVGPQCGVARDIASGEIVSGSPEIPHRVWLRVQNIVPKLPDMKKKISELEKRLERLEGKKDGESISD